MQLTFITLLLVLLLVGLLTVEGQITKTGGKPTLLPPAHKAASVQYSQAYSLDDPNNPTFDPSVLYNPLNPAFSSASNLVSLLPSNQPTHSPAPSQPSYSPPYPSTQPQATYTAPSYSAPVYVQPYSASLVNYHSGASYSNIIASYSERPIPGSSFNNPYYRQITAMANKLSYPPTTSLYYSRGLPSYPTSSYYQPSLNSLYPELSPYYAGNYEDASYASLPSSPFSGAPSFSAASYGGSSLVWYSPHPVQGPYTDVSYASGSQSTNTIGGFEKSYVNHDA